ncbi:MAG TPA: hypothetical protein DCP10_07930 [Bacteroidales bacterium]|nr:hypothetical protein [Bacteroidales bacterium]
MQESCAASPEGRQYEAKASAVSSAERALPATAGFEGRLSKYCEHSESEPILAVSRGKVAKSAEAQNPDTAERYNGCVTVQDSLLNGGSLYLCSCTLIQRTKQKQVERQESMKRVEVADESVVVIKSVPEKP